MDQALTSVDTDLHPHFRVFSAGNFGEVAPQRLSPMSWSLVGEPMERGTRELARRLWGSAPWATGSHFVFVGYLGCRPYHNLAAYCHLARSIPGLEPDDVTRAYFEGIAPPPDLKALRPPPLRRAFGARSLLAELAQVGDRLRCLEQRVAELERGVREAQVVDSALARYGVLRDAEAVLDDAWALHILTTSALVPLRAMQRRTYDRLIAHGDEIAHELNRPRELVWDRLHAASRAQGDYGPGGFISTSFYEVADSLDPWAGFTVRHRRDGATRPARSTGSTGSIEPAEAVASMLPKWRSRVVQAMSTTVSDTMAAREHSKSLAMRMLHVHRLLLPSLAADLGLSDGAWTYLLRREMSEIPLRPELQHRVDARRSACERALATPMPEHLDLSDGRGDIRPWQAEHTSTQRGVAPGVGTGVALQDHDEVPDEPIIIVCTSADADIAPLLPLAEGVLCERGSEFSHIAILSREYSVPCVVGYRDVSQIPPGAAVSINGTTGEVNIHAP